MVQVKFILFNIWCHIFHSVYIVLNTSWLQCEYVHIHIVILKHRERVRESSSFQCLLYSINAWQYVLGFVV